MDEKTVMSVHQQERHRQAKETTDRQDTQDGRQKTEDRRLDNQHRAHSTVQK